MKQQGLVLVFLSILFFGFGAGDDMVINLQIDDGVFNEVYLPHLTNDKRVQVYFGGSSSGKSVFLAQRTVLDVFKGGRNYLVVRKVKDSHRGSTFNEIQKAITQFELSKFFKVNETNMTMTCRNGYQIMFVGLDSVARLKSRTPKKGVITDIWVEEATEITYEDFKELDKRLRGLTPKRTLPDGSTSAIAKRFTLSFNPVFRTHWIFREFFADKWRETETAYTGEELSILKTTYKDNRFLEAEDRVRLEDEQDGYYYDVYTLGKWGVIGELVFTNWEVSDLSDMRMRFDVFHNGLDFGFSNHPSALSRSARHESREGKVIYIFDEMYERGLTNPQIAKKILPVVGREAVVCDSAEPKSIYELTEYGVNAMHALKGADSINFGIQWLRQHLLVVDEACQHHINELSLYQYVTNKSGEYLQVPLKKHDHLMDALRYAYSREIFTEPEGRVASANELGIF